METSLNILIVEDDALIAENLKMTLEDLGYTVVDTCYNYDEALIRIRQGGADLVMLDINLGSSLEHRNGITLAATLQSESRTPFIFLTAYDDTETILRATRLGPSAYLIKPVNAATLFAAVQTAIQASMDRTAPATTPAAGGLSKEGARPDFFFVKVGNRTHKLMWEDVFCLEAGKNYVKLRIVGHAADYPIRGTLNFVAEQLLPQRLKPQFVRFNRSTVLNLRQISGFDAATVRCGGADFENTRFTVRELQELLRTA